MQEQPNNSVKPAPQKSRGADWFRQPLALLNPKYLLRLAVVLFCLVVWFAVASYVF